MFYLDTVIVEVCDDNVLLWVDGNKVRPCKLGEIWSSCAKLGLDFSVRRKYNNWRPFIVNNHKITQLCDSETLRSQEFASTDPASVFAIQVK